MHGLDIGHVHVILQSYFDIVMYISYILFCIAFNNLNSDCMSFCDFMKYTS